MADLNKIIDELSKLTVVEAAELSKQLEEKWGVTAAAPAAAAPGPHNAIPNAAGADQAPQNLQTKFIMTKRGKQKLIHAGCMYTQHHEKGSC